jgi:hypothetical protein
MVTLGRHDAAKRGTIMSISEAGESPGEAALRDTGPDQRDS